MSKSSTIGQLFELAWERKIWWLIPMIVVFLLFGLLLIFTQASPIAPFIYTLF